MNKKALFILLLIAAVCAIAGVVIYTLRTPKPVLPAPVVSSTPTTTTIPVTTAPPAQLGTAPTKPAPEPGSLAEKERQARERMFQMAQDAVSRLGTYSNVDNYAAISLMYSQVTPEVKAYLEGERTQWRQAHPPGRQWGQTTRALTAQLAEEKPVLTATSVDLIVDTQQRINDAGTSSNGLKRARIQFTFKDGKWLISRLSWEEVAL